MNRSPQPGNRQPRSLVSSARLSDAFLRVDRRPDGSYDLGLPPFGDGDPASAETEPLDFSLAGAEIAGFDVEYHDGEFKALAQLQSLVVGAYSLRAEKQEIPLKWHLALDEREVSGEAALTLDRGQLAAAGELKTDRLDLVRIQRLAALAPLAEGEVAYQGRFSWQAPQLTLDGALQAPVVSYRVGDRSVKVGGANFPGFGLRLFTAPQLAVELAPREGSVVDRVDWETAQQRASAAKLQIAGRFRYEDNALVNLDLLEPYRAALADLGLSLTELEDMGVEPGLGNGGLGRLAACYLDSLATLEIPTLGYGIRYEYGIFHQELQDGQQVERSDKWLRHGNPWEIARPEWMVEVKFGGHTEPYTDVRGRRRVRWHPERVVMGVPYDTPVLGYRCNTANTLRLWRADAPETFDFAAFNEGDYYRAVESKVLSENLTKVLYPNDAAVQGKQLRLEQQFFFVSCALQDMIRVLFRQRLPLDAFHKKYAVQLNDTHPAIAEVQVFGVPDEKMGEEVCAWIQLRQGSDLDEGAIRAFCKDHIAYFKVPRYIRLVDDFPMTVTGKVQKFRMREIMVEELGL